MWCMVLEWCSVCARSTRDVSLLRVDARGKRLGQYAGVFAEWSLKDVQALRARSQGPTPETRSLVHPLHDPVGCGALQRCAGCALVVHQGDCTFAQKARQADAAGFALLVVVAKSGGAITMGAPQKGTWPSLLSMMISTSAGRDLLSDLRRFNDKEVTVSCLAPSLDLANLASDVLIGAFAVCLVAFGALYSVEDLTHPGNTTEEEVVAVTAYSGVQCVVTGSLMLTTLFFLMKYLIHVLIFVFATGAIATTTSLLAPLLSAWRPETRRRACRLPSWVGSILGTLEEHTVADAIAESVGVLLAVSFFFFRNDPRIGWVLQDIIASMLLFMLQRTTRVPNLRVGTILLLCMFFFDIYWVFLSEGLFKTSVMIEVATGGGTGQNVPMVLKIPFGGEFKILGLGDIALPGLVVSMLLRHDMSTRTVWSRGYFLPSILGYSVGLAATFVSLYVTNHGQPALLFLVPGVLCPTFALAWCRREVTALWEADYNPEVLPEGYKQLDGEDKQV